MGARDEWRGPMEKRRSSADRSSENRVRADAAHNTTSYEGPVPPRFGAWQPGELPPDPERRAAYGRAAIIWISFAVLMVVGGVMLLATRDASPPQATIQGRTTTGASGNL